MSKSEKALRTIGEASSELNIEPHVIRYWEQQFFQLKPVRIRGRRYYNPQAMTILRTIQKKLYQEKYTIAGVKKLFHKVGINKVIASAANVKSADANNAYTPAHDQIAANHNQTSNKQNGEPAVASDNDNREFFMLTREVITQMINQNERMLQNINALNIPSNEISQKTG